MLASTPLSWPNRQDRRQVRPSQLGSWQPNDSLDLLLVVLPIVQRISKTLERSRNREERSLREFLCSLRNAVFSFSYIFKGLKSAGFSFELLQYTERILQCLENAFSDDVITLVALKDLENHPYQRLHALRSYLLDVRGDDLLEEHKLRALEPAVLFGTQQDRDEISRVLTECFDELQVRFPEFPESEEVLPPRNRRREPLFTVWESANRTFSALSRCHGSICAKHRDHEARLTLATYSNVSDFDNSCNLDLIFAFDPDRCLWEEVRVHTSRLDSPEDQPKIRFALQPLDKDPWHLKNPKLIQHLCDALGKEHITAHFRLNLILEKDEKLWAHKPTKRHFLPANLHHTISLERLLSAPTKNWNEMEKLVLAVILGHSLFYLYKGPWLTDRWPRENIVFFQNEGSIPLRPFLRASVSSKQDIVSEDSESLFHQYPILVGFAVTLLEIHLGERLESFLRLGEPLTDINDQWARACEVFEKRTPFILGANYRNAIKACLDLEFGVEEYCDGEQLRGLIYSKIVEPLEAELEYGFSAFISIKDLDIEAPKMNLGNGLICFNAETKPATALPCEANRPETLVMPKSNTSLPIPRSLAPPNPTMIEQGVVSIDEEVPPIFSKPSNAGEVYALFGEENQPQAISFSDYHPTDQWFKKLKDLQNFKSLGELSRNDSRRVRIAILDTGIDMNHVDMLAEKDRIKKVCSWVDGKNGTEDRLGGDISGHGTHIASIVLDIAPNADIYIARVTKTRLLNERQADQIAQAIKVARTVWCIDIINLSFGFTKGIESIQNEINEALNNNIIIFAAASNDGGNSGRAYPAWHSRIFCIHSTDGYGNKSPYNPTAEEDDNFSIVGQYLKSSWPNPNQAHATRRMSGTSFATPVAAGLAALVLDWVSQVMPELETFINLKSYDGMRHVFRLMSQERDPGYRYLSPFEFFGRMSARVQDDILAVLNPMKL